MEAIWALKVKKLESFFKRKINRAIKEKEKKRKERKPRDGKKEKIKKESP